MYFSFKGILTVHNIYFNQIIYVGNGSIDFSLINLHTITQHNFKNTFFL